MDLIIKNSENSFKWDIAEKISIPFNFKIILIGKIINFKNLFII